MRRTLLVGAAVAIVVVGCRGGGEPGSEVSLTPPSSVTTVPPAPAVTAPASTSVPPPTLPPGVEVEVAAPCEVPDATAVAAPVSSLGGHLAASEEVVWVSSFASGGLLRIDPDTMCLSEPIPIPAAPLGAAAITLDDEGNVYVAATRSGGVSVVSPDGKTVTEFPAAVSGGGGLAVADGRLWAVCCEAEIDGEGGGVFDLASGELIADLPTEAGVGIEVIGDTAWVGRRDVAGLQRVTLSGDTAEVELYEAFGSTTYSVAASNSAGIFMIGDEPVVQRFTGDSIDEHVVVPFPRQRPVDMDMAEDGSLFAVTPFGPGVVLIRPDGLPYALLGAEDLLEVEVAGSRVWALTTAGVLVRMNLDELLEG